MNHGLPQNGVHAGLIPLPFPLEPRHNIGVQFAGNGNFYRLKHLALFPGAEFGKVGYFGNIGQPLTRVSKIL
jgi:hypothetical protein